MDVELIQSHVDGFKKSLSETINHLVDACQLRFLNFALSSNVPESLKMPMYRCIIIVVTDKFGNMRGRFTGTTYYDDKKVHGVRMHDSDCAMFSQYHEAEKCCLLLKLYQPELEYNVITTFVDLGQCETTFEKLYKKKGKQSCSK